MPVTPKEMVRILEQNGFEKVSQKGSHLKMRNQEKGLSVIVPMHAKDIPQGTEKAILKQAGLK
jgi:predicted RNA binding protein YcfA (HicA-like mRNA interferase family)